MTEHCPGCTCGRVIEAPVIQPRVQMARPMSAPVAPRGSSPKLAAGETGAGSPTYGCAYVLACLAVLGLWIVGLLWVVPALASVWGGQ